MSKILKALEKAKRDLAPAGEAQGTVSGASPAVESAAGTVVQRRSPTGPSRRRKRAAGPVAVTRLDREILQGVDPCVETLHKPMSVVSEQFRTLRSRLERLNFEGRIQTLVVTSALKGEGKSVTASNLAVVLAQDPTKDVLLVDADLRRPRIHRLLNLDGVPGLAEHLQGEASLDAVVRRTPYYGLTVVPAGSSTGHPAELVASPEFQEFLDRMRAQYDYVVLDSPPLHPISDVSFLVDAVDGILIVVRAHRTNRGLLKQVVEALPAEKIVGTVLNRAESLRTGYGYGYGSGYYYGYGYK